MPCPIRYSMLVVSAFTPFKPRKKRIVVWNKIKPIIEAKVATSLSSLDIPCATDIQNRIGNKPNSPPARALIRLTKSFTNPTFANAFPNTFGFSNVDAKPNNKPAATMMDNGPIKDLPSFCINVFIPFFLLLFKLRCAHRDFIHTAIITPEVLK